MNIVLEIKEDGIFLLLKKGSHIVDKISWRRSLDLSEKLLKSLDKILIKNNLKPEDIKKMTVKSGISDNLTSVRIAKIVAKTFNFYTIVD